MGRKHTLAEAHLRSGRFKYCWEEIKIAMDGPCDPVKEEEPTENDDEMMVGQILSLTGLDVCWTLSQGLG